jgi:hypothetical protein
MEQMNYYTEFINAVKRTETWGFNTGEIILDKGKTFLDRNSHFELFELFEWNYKGLSDSTRMDCTNVSVNMLELVRDHFCTDAYLTTGNITADNKPFFECTVDYLRDIASKTQFNPKLKVHMWITLSSGEIVDFTFLRSMAKVNKDYEPYKSVVMTTPFLEDLKLVYSPMIVGSDFYRKTGNMVDVILT